MASTIRNSEISTTTPLFGGKNKNTFSQQLSPTKSLNFSRADVNFSTSYQNLQNEIDNQQLTASGSTTSFATGQSSFATANSYVDSYNKIRSSLTNAATLSLDLADERATMFSNFESTTPLVLNENGKKFTNTALITPERQTFVIEDSDDGDENSIFATPLAKKTVQPVEYTKVEGLKNLELLKTDSQETQSNYDTSNTVVLIKTNETTNEEQSEIKKITTKKTLQSDEKMSIEESDSMTADTTRESIAKKLTQDISMDTSYANSDDYSEIQSTYESIELTDNNLARMFIVALHSFSTDSLENPNDIHICLSFEQDDVAFIHSIDDSGWGEVTMVKNQARGWVPFNYFTEILQTPDSTSSENAGLGLSIPDAKKPLAKLLATSARFLLNPQNKKIENSEEYTYNIKYINGIRDGVKLLLEETNCVSRSNEMVESLPVLKKARKRLLADWYSLMIKADQYKYTTSETQIQKLVNLVFDVLKRAFAFYATWYAEKGNFKSSQSKETIQSPTQTLKSSPSKNSLISRQLDYLKTAPNAISRLHEIYGILTTYIGLILGRMDLIERNPYGCESLEFIVHQMILLLRELLYISKSCSSIMQKKYHQEYENSLDKSLDPLLSMVSDLVTCIKVLVTQSMSDASLSKDIIIKKDSYCYTENGKKLILIVAKMASLITNSVTNCNNYLRIIGDFKLGASRQYPDLSNSTVTPEMFIKKCSAGLVRKLGKKSLRKSLKITSPVQSKHKHPFMGSKISRYSTIRAGHDKELAFTTEGTQFLNDVLQDQPFSRNSIFAKYKIDSSELEVDSGSEYQVDAINDSAVMEREVVMSKENNFIGASFRALIYKMTENYVRLDELLISTVLLNFRSFDNTTNFVDYLIARFEVSNNSNQNSRGYSVNLAKFKGRRKLICKIFQLWLESYWDFELDGHMLPTIVNFFNEGMSLHLPMESRSLIELAARLFVKLHEVNNSETGLQLVSKILPYENTKESTLTLVSSSSSSSDQTHRSVYSVDEKFIEEYELTHVTAPSSHNSISLPIPVLSIGRSALLSKSNIQDMERILRSYKTITGRVQLDSHESETTHINSRIDTWKNLINDPNKAYKNLIHNDMNLVDLNPLEVAKQLTLIESNLFMAIKPFEMVGNRFLNDKLSKNKAPNVEAIMNFTNQLSHYVIESILSESISVKARAARLKGWLKVALSVLYFRNFNSVASIMTALQNHVITRLGFIWNMIDKKDIDLYDYLSKIIHPNKNFKVYRSKLNSIMTSKTETESQTNVSSLPVVPFFNLFLQDLTFISEGNTTFRNPDSFRPNKIVNIDKFFKVTKIISTIQYFQVPYDSPGLTINKRESFFTLSNQMDIDTNNIAANSLLQEFILYEFWRVDTLFGKENDRGYQLSIKLLPRA